MAGQERTGRGGAVGWRVATLAAAGGVGALALADWLANRVAGEPPAPLAGEQRRFAWTHGDIAYTVRGRGEPLLLLHGIYAGTSSFEWRRVFGPLSEHFRVYAPDLLGFGLSRRPALAYTSQLYQALIQDFLRQVVGGADTPVHVVASSLTAAFAIRVAAERPDLFRSLVLIEPTGIEDLADAEDTPARRALHGLLRAPLMGQAIYDVITSRAGIRYYLRDQAYADPAMVSDDLIDAYYAQAHQPGARHAAAAFISGALNTPVADVFSGLRVPTLLVWGRDARMTPLVRARAFRVANPRADLRVFDCGALPQDELPGPFTDLLAEWLPTASIARH